MKELEFMELLSELPPEYIEAAAGPQKKRRGIIFRKHYGIPVIAACLVVMIAAVIYPRLRVEKPEQIPEPAQTTYTTSVSGTSPYEAEETAIAATSLTTRDAAAELTVTAVQSAEQTAAGGTRDTRPAQTAASAQNGAPTQNHAAEGSSAPAANTTAGQTANTRTTTKPTAGTTAPARTTVRTTARTTAPPAATTVVTARTTAPPYMATTWPARTTALNAVTTTPGAIPHVTTALAMRTTRPPEATTGMTAPHMTTAVEGTTTRNGSSGGDNWHPGGSPAAGPGDDPGHWHHSGSDPANPPEYKGTAEFFVMQAVVLCTDEDFKPNDGQAFFGMTEDGESYILPDDFAGCAIPDGMDPSDYTVLPMFYYGYISDAAVTGIENPEYNQIEPSICVLETGDTFRVFSVLFWIPKSVPVDAGCCNTNIAVEWNADSYYGNLPDTGDVFNVQLWE